MHNLSILFACLMLALPAGAQNLLLPVRVEGKWGCIDATGKIIITPQYEFISTFRDRKAIAQQNHHLGVIDATGKVLLPFEHLNLDTLAVDCFATRNAKGAWGAINIAGKKILPAQFEEIKARYSNNKKNTLLQARQGNVWLAYNTEGVQISPTACEDFRFLNDTLIEAKQAGRYGVFTLAGKEILPTAYETFVPYPYHRDYFLVRQYGRMGLMHQTGKIAMPCEYDYIEEWNKNPNSNAVNLRLPQFFEVGKAGRKGLFSSDFQELVPAEFDYIKPLPQYPDLFEVGTKNSKGLFDRTKGKLVLACIYREIELASPTLVIIYQEKDGVVLAGVQNFITNVSLIPLTYHAISLLQGGNRTYFIAQLNGFHSIFSQQGAVLMRDMKIDGLSFDKAGIFILQKDNLYGLLNEFALIKPQFDFISNFRNNLALLKLNGFMGLINALGQIIASPQYTAIKMYSSTAKCTRTDGGTDVITFDAQGNFIDRVTFATKVKSLSIKKTNSADDTKGTEWEFDLEEKQRNAQLSPTPSFANVRVNNSYPARPFTPFNMDSYSFVFDQSVRKWRMQKTGSDTLMRAVFDYVNDIPALHLVQTAQTITETEGTDKGKIFLHWGLFDTQTGKWIFSPTKNAGFYTQNLIRDFSKGEVGRLLTSYLHRNGKRMQTINLQTQKTETKYIFYSHPYDSLTNLSEFNVGGNIIDRKSMLHKINLEGGTWGLMDRKGNMATPPIYEKFWLTNNLYFALKKNYIGVVDSAGKEIVPCAYTDISYLENAQKQPVRDFLLLSWGVQRTGFLDSTRVMAIDAIYQEARHFREGFAPVRRDSLVGKVWTPFWSLVDRQGHLLHPFVFTEVRHFHEGLAAVKIGQKWGYLNPQGQISISPAYSQAFDFHEGKAAVREFNTGKMHYIDASGTRVGKFSFNKAGDFERGIAVAQDTKTNLFGLLNAQGAWVLPPRYASISDFNEQGYAFYQKELGAKIGLLDRQGKALTPCRYTAIEPFENGFARVSKGKEWNFIDSTGACLLKKDLRQLQTFEGNLSLAYDEKGWGYLNRKGKWQIPPVYQRATTFVQGVAQVKPINNPKNIFIDTLGREVPQPKDWYNLGDLEECKADSLLPIVRVRKGDRWGYWDKQKGYAFMYPIYSKATAFYNGYARVADLRGNMYYLNLQKQALPALPDGVRWYDSEKDQFKLIRKNGLYGFVTLQDFAYSEPKFAHVGEAHEGRVKAVVKALYGVADRQGNVLLQPIYERVVYMENGIFRVETNDRIGYWHKTKGWIWEARR